MAPGAATLRTEDNVAAKSIFTFLSPADLEYARLHARPRHMLAGTLLFLEGEPSAGLILVQRGALRLFTAHAGKELTLHVVLRGETCNEFAAGSGSVNLTSAEAIDDTTVLTLAPTHVSYLFGRSNGFARALVATMADRALHFVALVGDLSFHHVTGRVAKVLLQSVSSAPGVGAGTGRRSLTQQELADLVGTAREVVARSLRTFYAMGAIAQVRGRIVVLDRRLLEDAVEESCAITARTPSPAQHRPHVVGARSPVVTPAPRAPTCGPPPRPAPPESETEMAVATPLREKLSAVGEEHAHALAPHENGANSRDRGSTCDRLGSGVQRDGMASGARPARLLPTGPLSTRRPGRGAPPVRTLAGRDGSPPRVAVPDRATGLRGKATGFVDVPLG